MSSFTLLRRPWCVKKAINLSSTKISPKVSACFRYISTSDKSRDTVTVKQQVSTAEAATKKNWMSFGYDTNDQEIDTNAANSIMFFSVTLCMIIGGFLFAYMPDYQLRDWSQREAYIELRRREKNGLPLVDPNYVDPSKIDLPSDEELGDTEIII